MHILRIAERQGSISFYLLWSWKVITKKRPTQGFVWIRKYLNQSAAEQIIHAFVTSQLDNGNAPLYGLPQNQISRHQHIQNAAACVVTLSRKSCQNYTTTTLYIILYKFACTVDLFTWIDVTIVFFCEVEWLQSYGFWYIFCLFLCAPSGNFPVLAYVK